MTAPPGSVVEPQLEPQPSGDLLLPQSRKYTYTSLNENAKETRVVILPPGLEEDALYARLETISLLPDDHGVTPILEALSYA